MRWKVVLPGLALAFGLSVSGTATHAQTMSIGDVRLLEGNAGTVAFDFDVTLSAASPSPVSASWATADGTATVADSDYAAGFGTVSFPALSTLQTVTVTVNGDATPEPDEVFYVDLSNPVGATLLERRGVGTILDDDTLDPPVEAFGVTSDGDAANGRNRLQWFVPAGAVTASQVVVRFNEGASCVSPATPAAGTGGFTVPSPVADSSHVEVHGSLVLDQKYCYSVWLDYGGGSFSPVEQMSAQPFDATTLPANVKWKYFSGTTTLAAPTVGFDGVIVPSNDGYIHAMERDPLSPDWGTWPAMPWRPRDLGSAAQHRMPVVPLAGRSRAFISTQDGRVHAVDTANGNLLWSTQLPEGAAQGAPAGIFTAFGGAYDYVLVGTSAGGSANRLYALDPFTGAVIDAFPDVGAGGAEAALASDVGAILGMPSVDYGNRRVYFASLAQGPTIWCVSLGPPADALQLGWTVLTNDIDGSVVLHNGRVYAGTVGGGSGSGEVFSLSASDGSGYSTTLDGAVQGFLFPDRRGNDLYAATHGDTQDWVEAITDTGSLSAKWSPEPILDTPSVVLHHPGTDDIYVGVRDYGPAPVTPAIVKISAFDGSYVSHVDLESTAPAVLFSIGPPSLDLGHGMLYVGSVPGIIYAVALAGF